MGLLVPAVVEWVSRPMIGASALYGLPAALGMLLLAGLWTPVVGALVVADALWNVVAFGHAWRWIMIATLGAALALLGPGAWSVDARLFGLKRVEIPDRKRQDPPSL
jgi:hypothetical protein